MAEPIAYKDVTYSSLRKLVEDPEANPNGHTYSMVYNRTLKKGMTLEKALAKPRKRSTPEEMQAQELLEEKDYRYSIVNALAEYRRENGLTRHPSLTSGMLRGGRNAGTVNGSFQTEAQAQEVLDYILPRLPDENREEFGISILPPKSADHFYQIQCLYPPKEGEEQEDLMPKQNHEKFMETHRLDKSEDPQVASLKETVERLYQKVLELTEAQSKRGFIETVKGKKFQGVHASCPDCEELDLIDLDSLDQDSLDLLAIALQCKFCGKIYIVEW